MYDTLESALKQKEHMRKKAEVSAAMKQSAVPGQGSDKSRQKSSPVGIMGVAGGAGPGAAVFTPKQLKLIKQQQKLLDKLQKKTEREAERRRRSEVRRKRREETRKKGKKNKNNKVSGYDTLLSHGNTQVMNVI